MLTKTVVVGPSGIVLTCLLLLAADVQSQTLSSQNLQDRSAVKCQENSPERRGDEGCTILASRPISGTIKGSVYWHIDKFDSLEKAKKAAGPNAVAVEAHGSVWLTTVENKTENHHGGRHVALIGPLILPDAESYTMNVRSTLLRQGASTPVHRHSGPEVFYVVKGEQCLETQKAGHRLSAGKWFVLETDLVHRGRVQSAAMRGALTLVLHDSLRPASYDLTDPPQLMPCTK